MSLPAFFLAGMLFFASLAQAQSVTGAIVDSDGDVISGAAVSLTLGNPADPLTERKAVSLPDGSFRFTGVPSGPFRLIIRAPGMAPETTTGVLGPEDYTLPRITLRIASTSEGVDVVLTRREESEVEVRTEEKQRLAGLLPNFYVSYVWNAAPLTKKQKFDLAWRTTLDPATFFVNGAIAGVEQGTGSLKGYGQGARGYGKRFGAATADTAIGNLLGGAVFPVLFRQDPRYFYKGTGTFVSRALYALATAVICRGDNGRWQPNYSSVLGDLAAGAVSNLYYPAGDRNSASLTIENGLLETVSDAVGNLVQEFVFRRITPHVTGNGKP